MRTAAGTVAESDVSAYEEFFRRHAVRVVRLAALLGAGDPEDVAQDAFCRVFAARTRLHGIDDSAVPYLNRTVVNLVRSRRRRDVVAGRNPPAADVVDSAELAATRRDDLRRVAEAVAALPARQREAVVLRYWLDLSYAGIAAAMGVRIGTAKSSVSRALVAVCSRLRRSDGTTHAVGTLRRGGECRCRRRRSVAAGRADARDSTCGATPMGRRRRGRGHADAGRGGGCAVHPR